MNSNAANTIVSTSKYTVRLTAAVVATVACLSLAALPAHAQTRVVLQLDWIFNAQFAGVYQAIEQGYFAGEGLVVEVRRAEPGLATVPLVMAQDGIVFGSAESNVVMGGFADGHPLRIAGTMFQGSPIGWMFLRSSGITSIADFAGKRIGIHSDGDRVLKVMTRAHNVTVDDFELPKIGHNPQALLDGEVDAMQCYVIDEFVKLRMQAGDQAAVILARDHDYSAYSQVVFTTAYVTENHPDVVAGFIRALRRGWAYALQHPEATVDLILSRYNPQLDRSYQLGSLAEIDGLVRPDGTTIMQPPELEVLQRSLAMYASMGVLPADLDLAPLMAIPE
jgi:ABC-type nitrate/sulfonate/bicarbonate transport system substrate-binding protein